MDVVYYSMSDEQQILCERETHTNKSSEWKKNNNGERNENAENRSNHKFQHVTRL